MRNADSRPMSRSRVASLPLVAAAIIACVPSPVEWVDDRIAGAEGSVLAIDGAGRAAWRDDPPLVAPTLPSGEACPGSVRFARAGGAEMYGVWWAPRPDGSVRLLSARSVDGGLTWAGAVPVDTVDRGHRACARPAPAVAADSTTGYVHVVYYLEGPDGPGLFFSHAMDRGELFHEPVPVVYGEGPVTGAVAADGNTVVVAYEDPNALRPRIGLQISRTMGHLFEERIPVVSTGNAASTEPGVAVRGRTLAVGWVERPTGSRGDEPGIGVVKVGEIR